MEVEETDEIPFTSEKKDNEGATNYFEEKMEIIQSEEVTANQVENDEKMVVDSGTDVQKENEEKIDFNIEDPIVNVQSEIDESNSVSIPANSFETILDKSPTTKDVNINCENITDILSETNATENYMVESVVADPVVEVQSKPKNNDITNTLETVVNDKIESPVDATSSMETNQNMQKNEKESVVNDKIESFVTGSDVIGSCGDSSSSMETNQNMAKNEKESVVNDKIESFVTCSDVIGSCGDSSGAMETNQNTTMAKNEKESVVNDDIESFVTCSDVIGSCGDSSSSVETNQNMENNEKESVDNNKIESSVTGSDVIGSCGDASSSMETNQNMENSEKQLLNTKLDVDENFSTVDEEMEIIKASEEEQLSTEICNSGGITTTSSGKLVVQGNCEVDSSEVVQDGSSLQTDNNPYIEASTDFNEECPDKMDITASEADGKVDTSIPEKVNIHIGDTFEKIEENSVNPSGDQNADAEKLSSEKPMNLEKSCDVGITNEQFEQKVLDVCIKQELNENDVEQNMEAIKKEDDNEKEENKADNNSKVKEEKDQEQTDGEKMTNRGLIISNIVSRLATVGTKSQTLKDEDHNSASTSVVKPGKGDHTDHVRKSPGAARKMPTLSPIKNNEITVINDNTNNKTTPTNQKNQLSCSNCCQVIAEVDLKKWTKNSSGQEQQFCSSACMNINPFKSPLCTLCRKDMKGIQDMKISAPSGPSGRFLEFCSHTCVMTYEERKNSGTHCYCTVCSSLIVISQHKHSLKLKGRLYRLCSPECQKAFMKDNHVQPVKTCLECKNKFTNEGVTQEVKGVKHVFCSDHCQQQNLKTSTTKSNFTNCLICKKINNTKDLKEVAGPDGEKHLVCTGLCVTRLMHRLKTRNISILPKSTSVGSVKNGQTHVMQTLALKSTKQLVTTTTTSQTGKTSVYATTPVNCNHCNTYQAPLYHLTMSDNTVRNFCSYPCVIGFQSQFNMPPVTLPQEELKLHCKYCKQHFNGKPVTLSWKNDVHFFCSENCSATYKKTFCVIILCDNCEEERIHHSTIYFAGKERNFCSEGCLLLYKQSFTQKLGLRWCICNYCSQIGPTVFEKKGSEGITVKFCSKKCREKYDQWQKQLVKCEGCKQQGRLLNETFMWRGEVKKVCNQLCLLLFYTQQNMPNMLTEVQQNIYNGKPQQQQPSKVASSTLPVISNVFSFASDQKPIPQKKTEVEMITKQTQITTTPVQHKPASLPNLPPLKQVRNKMTLCKPIQQTKSTYCKPLSITKESNTEVDWRPKLVVVPIPVPIYIPVPMQMYTTPVPHPVGIPTPIPVPMFLPVSTNNAEKLIQTIKDIKNRMPSDPLEAELLAMADAIAGEEEIHESIEFEDLNLFNMETEDTETSEEELPVCEEPLLDENEIKQLEADILALSEVVVEDAISAIEKCATADKVNSPYSEGTTSRSTRSGRQPTKAEVKQPSSTKKRKRANPRASTRNKRAKVESDSEEEIEMEKPDEKEAVQDRHYSIGVGAYKLWVVQKNAELKKKLQPGCKEFSFKEDILSNTSDELSYTLSHFVKEARKPNGDEYPPALLFYILLAIQHYLFNSGHPDNILTDLIFSRFMEYLVERIRSWEPVFKPDTNIVINSNITEELMWECKQLGAHSPYVLLNTLVYFNTKFFILKTPQEHKNLLFGMMFKDWKKSGPKNKVVCLRYFPSKMRKKLEETTCKVKKRSLLEKYYLEQTENLEDPLQCPVKLYEFYLSKCPESVKGKQNSLYLIPERMCIPDSPVWYSSCMLDDAMLEKMVAKALMVKDVHEYWAGKEREMVDEDGDYSPVEEDS